MNSAYSSTSKHCDRQLHDHGHVNRNAIALIDSVHFENVGEAANLLEKLSVSQPAVVIGVVSFPRKMMIQIVKLSAQLVAGYK